MYALAAAGRGLGGSRLGSGSAGNADTHSLEEHGPRSRRSSFRAEIIFKLPRDESEIIFSAISPETRDVPSRRVSVNIKLIDDGLALRIEAMDLVALRAALNSFIRFIDSTLSVIRSIT